ncbi:DDE-type integrase/transposase/recombinase [Jannaschia faecimaris]|uniref:DDE-type integrase/transposase/recombinase n=1 Tax=Jannaschia faecimaris TaxID=1244108 RepID=UPI001FCCE396|nr:DDE-type integrase/transposase/recombinase [Jannaschia faecimaris]
MRKHGRTVVTVTDRLWSYSAALREIGNAGCQNTGRRLNNRTENSHQLFRQREQAMLLLQRIGNLQKSAANSSVSDHSSQ